MGPFRLPSVRWPLLLLLASIGFTAVGVFEANRAIQSQRTVAEHALRDYAGFVSWSYQQHLREALSAATHELLGAVNHGDDMHTSPVIPDSRNLPHYLSWNPECACRRAYQGPSPAIFFGFKLGTDTLGFAVNTHSDPTEGWEIDRPLPATATPGRMLGYSAAERAWINDTLTSQIRRSGERMSFPFVISTFDSVPRVLVYTLMPTAWGDTLVYGAEYGREAFRGLLTDVMSDRRLLPQTFTRGLAAREIVQIQISDANGREMYASEPLREQQWEYDDSVRLSPAYGSLLVRAQIRPALAGNLVIGGLPRSRLPFLLGLLVVAAALSLVAIGQMRREGELARMRTDFVASISHELRTPLAQMRLYLDTLRLGRFTTESQRDWSLDNIERETTRLSHLVERVLRFSRSGRPDDEAREHVDAAAEVSRIAAEFQPLAMARGATVLVDARPSPPLSLRPAALRHVVLNLLDNAVKYGPSGQTIRVGVQAVDGEVHISVADQGPGVSAADREAVWRPYERGRSAGHTAGSGLGLSIVRDVSQQHGGRAWIEEPREGSGAVVIVALPVLKETSPQVAPGAVRASEPVHG